MTHKLFITQGEIDMAKKSDREMTEGLADEGVAGVEEGIETLEAAADVADVGREALAAGASDVTRGVDEMVVADRLAAVSEIVGVAGVTDVVEGMALMDE
jgi:hypothetical protein